MAAAIAARMDAPVTALGVIFLLVVLADGLASDEGPLAVALDVLAWSIWAVFVVELVLRWVVAPDSWSFLRRNWWQVLFLAVPFLRFVRILARLRLARAGRVVSSAFRTGRSATARLSSRLGWLMAVTCIVVLAASQLLHELAGLEPYGEALHRTALTTVTGEPLGVDDGLAQVVELVLALYSVVVFATLAGTLGAFFLEQRADSSAPTDRSDRVPTHGGRPGAEDVVHADGDPSAAQEVRSPC